MKTTASTNVRRLTVLLLAILFAASTLLSCTREPRKPADIQGDGYAFTKEWVTWYIEHQLMQKGKVPSVVIALVDDQDVVWQEAFGYADLEEKKLASFDTVYRVGSVTKTFTALAIMKLYEDAIIDLDAPITDYLPDFSMKSRFPDSDPITIRSLLSHRSGLTDPENRFFGEYTGLEFFERISLQEIVDSLKDDYVPYPVGYRFNYSTSGFAVLGRIIEVMTGRDYSDYMQENILNPLGMSDSTFYSSSVEEGEMATGYYIYDNKALVLPLFDYSNLSGAALYGGLLGTATIIG
jgi:CubicO group peptidase (beta-lactamase class C family)